MISQDSGRKTDYRHVISDAAFPERAFYEDFLFKIHNSLAVDPPGRALVFSPIDHAPAKYDLCVCECLRRGGGGVRPYLETVAAVYSSTDLAEASIRNPLSVWTSKSWRNRSDDASIDVNVSDEGSVQPSEDFDRVLDGLSGDGRRVLWSQKGVEEAFADVYLAFSKLPPEITMQTSVAVVDPSDLHARLRPDRLPFSLVVITEHVVGVEAATPDRHTETKRKFDPYDALAHHFDRVPSYLTAVLSRAAEEMENLVQKMPALVKDLKYDDPRRQGIHRRRVHAQCKDMIDVIRTAQRDLNYAKKHISRGLADLDNDSARAAERSEFSISRALTTVLVVLGAGVLCYALWQAVTWLLR